MSTVHFSPVLPHLVFPSSSPLIISLQILCWWTVGPFYLYFVLWLSVCLSGILLRSWHACCCGKQNKQLHRDDGLKLFIFIHKFCICGMVRYLYTFTLIDLVCHVFHWFSFYHLSSTHSSLSWRCSFHFKNNQGGDVARIITITMATNNLTWRKIHERINRLLLKLGFHKRRKHKHKHNSSEKQARI